MQAYLITIWDQGRKWSQLVHATHSEDLKKQYRSLYNRVTIEPKDHPFNVKDIEQCKQS